MPLPTPDELRALLEQLATGNLGVDDVVRAALQTSNRSPENPVGAPPDLRIDHDRPRRCGHPEAIFGEGKTVEQITAAARALLDRNRRALVTRVDPNDAATIVAALSGYDVTHHEAARCITAYTEGAAPPARACRPTLILSAGTTDVPVAEEARVTAAFEGLPHAAHYDVGVAGLHRLLELQGDIADAGSMIVVAGMDGALPSVVAGLASCPVIGVPTSVGYGAALGGVAPLLSMLNACAAGLAVVNIDNGFGAAMLAARIATAHDDNSSHEGTGS